MKNIFFTILVFVGLSAFGQSTTITTNQTTTTTAELSPKAKALCATWLLSETENFGDKHPPSELQKRDQLVLLDNGRYRLIKDGAAQGGTWTLDKSNVWLTLTAEDKTVIKFQILASTADTLKVDYRDADDIHNVIYYVISKSGSTTISK